MNYDTLLKIIDDKSAKIGIVGLGYVGLPLALVFSSKNFNVTGFDVDPDKIDRLLEGESYIRHIENDLIRQQISSKSFKVTDDFSSLAQMSVIIICVPTPLNQKREPDLTYVKNTAKEISKHLQVGQLIILESTTYPGCCNEIVKPILEVNGLVSGKDFYLAYSPEREDPGNPEYSTAVIPKVVGGDGSKALFAATSLYNKIVVETVPVSSMDVAEAVKLTENVFRSVNIALVNELKAIYEKMGIDIWEVIKAAETKPFGYMPFYPGPGLGGHCIPIDPFYLTWRASQVGEQTRFIELAGEINTAMPGKIVNKLILALMNRSNTQLGNARILLIGVAYKKDVGDTRESPAFVLIDLLESSGATVDYFDPYVPSIPKTRKFPALEGRSSVLWNTENIANYDAVVICTDHEGLPYEELIEFAKLVIDTRNVVGRHFLASDNVIKA